MALSQFKTDATWNRKPRFSDSGAFSYESHGHPGEYLESDHKPLLRKPASSDHDKIAATFVDLGEGFFDLPRIT
jgi:hypothetical protein